MAVLAMRLAAGGLPSSLGALREHYGTQLAAVDMESGVGLDTWGHAGRPRFVLLAAAGEPLLDLEVPLAVVLA